MRSVAYVMPTFWTRGSGKALRGDPDRLLVFLYLLTSPASNLIGLYREPLFAIAGNMGFTVEQTAELLASLVPLAKYDADEELVWLPDALSHNVGVQLSPSDRRGPAIVREALEFEGHPFFSEFFIQYEQGYRLSVLIERFRRRRRGSWNTSSYAEVYERDGSRCRYCGATEELSVDHIVPRAQGGSDNPENLAVACRSCNSRKGPRTPAEAGMVLQ